MFCPETKKYTDFLCGCFDCDQLSSIERHQPLSQGAKVLCKYSAAVITVTFSGCIIVDGDWKCQTEFVLVNAVPRCEPIYCTVRYKLWPDLKEEMARVSSQRYYDDGGPRLRNVWMYLMCYCDSAVWRTNLWPYDPGIQIFIARFCINYM